MKIIVAGSRTFNDYQLLEETLDDIIQSRGITQPIIISGTASGADSLGERYAEKRGYQIMRFKPDWQQYGKSAGYIRNKEMADAADLLIAFWDGQSKGTEMMIQIMKKQNKSGVVVQY